ncbi:hypothetical protein [Desulfitobacterium hafniense]|nr:hypothetical protein [Desulfitobacterium hafniense]
MEASNQLKANGANRVSSGISENLLKKNTDPIIDDQGGLQVSAKWGKQEGSSVQQFSVGFSNHAVNVDNFDFAKNLQFQINNKVIPIKVEILKKNGSGHHLEAELRVESPEFAKATAGSTLTMSVKNVYNTPTRNFTWRF